MPSEQIRHATEADLDDIVALLRQVFGVGGRWTPAAFRNFYFADSNYEPSHSLLVECDGRIVSHVRFSPRLTRVGEALVQTGALSSVATLPDYRGRGYASALLRESLACMERRGDAISMLFTDIQPFYEPMGWVPYPQYSVQKYLFASKWRGRRRAAAPPGVTVRPIERGRDLLQCAKLHAEGNAPLSLSTCRNDVWWTDGYAWSWEPSMDRFLVAEREGEVVEYLRAMVLGSEVAIMDAGPLAGEGSAQDHMLHRVLADCPAARTVGGPVPRDGRLDQAIRCLPGETREWESEGMMLRLLDLRAFAANLLPEVSRRCESLPPEAWRGELTIALPGEAVRMDLLDQTTAGLPRREAKRVEMSAQDFLLMTFGYADASRLCFARDGKLPREVVATLSHVFPVRPQVFWSIDRF